MNDLSFVFAFVAGLVSFLSPCVLPIIPGFLAYLAGTTGNQSDKKRDSRWTPFIASIFFVLGFSVVFALLGVLLNTVLQNVAYDFQTWLARIGGLVIILFGLYLTKIIRIPWLERNHQFSVKRRWNSYHVTSFVFGAAFAAGWTPCVGAVLGAILGLAATNPGSAFSLLMTYAVGLGIPFLIVGLFTSQAEKFIARHSRSLAYVTIIFGYVLVALGILVFTGSLALVANFDFVNKLVL